MRMQSHCWPTTPPGLNPAQTRTISEAMPEERQIRALILLKPLPKSVAATVTKSGTISGSDRQGKKVQIASRNQNISKAPGMHKWCGTVFLCVEERVLQRLIGRNYSTNPLLRRRRRASSFCIRWSPWARPSQCASLEVALKKTGSLRNEIKVCWSE